METNLLILLIVTGSVFITGIVLLVLYFGKFVEDVIDFNLQSKDRPEWMFITGLVFVLVSSLVFSGVLLDKLDKLLFRIF
jgi:hypothetical protein